MSNWKYAEDLRSNFYLIENEIKEYMDRYEVSVFSFEIIIFDCSNNLA